MKVTMINKLNVIVSLWILAIMGTLMIFGYQLNMNGFYYAGLVMAAVLFIINTCHLVFGICVHNRSLAKAKAEYKKY